MAYLVHVVCHTSTNNIPAVPFGVNGRYETREAAIEAAKHLHECSRAILDIDIINDTPGAVGPLRETFIKCTGGGGW